VEVAPRYQQTALGRIPGDWRVSRLGEIADIASGGTPSRSEARFWNGGIPWVTTSEIGFNVIRATEESLSSEGLQSSAARLFPAGTLLLAMYGQGKTRGKVAILGIGAATNQACAAIALRRGVSPEFAFQFLASRYDHIRNLSNTGNQENLNSHIVRSILVPLPSLPEQEAIAQALASVDALLEGLGRLVAKKRDLKQAAMQQLLTGETRLPGFSGEWATSSFDEVLIRINAKPNQVQATAYRTAGHFPVVDQGATAVIGFSDDGDRLFRCPKGGVIVFGDHTCIVKFVDFDFLVGADGTQVMSARGGHVTRFIAYDLQRKGVVPTGYNRHFGFLRERTFTVPNLPEQEAITAVLSDMDAELEALEVRREKTRLLKQGMMQELLTGRIRLV